MTHAVMDAPDRTRDESGSTTDPVHALIAAARESKQPALRALLVAGLSALLTWAAFTPLDWGPLGWICFVPLLWLVRIERPTRRMLLMTYVGGLAYWTVTLQWMRLGDPAMYPAWLALAAYLACYWPLFVGLSRVAVHRFGAPFVVAIPVLWVGLEYLRSHLLTGFSWYMLGHTQYRWSEIVQVSDLVGGYGVSFLVMMSNACIAFLVPASVYRRFGLIRADGIAPLNAGGLRPRFVAVGVTMAAVLCAWGYGTVRRSQESMPLGPRVALIQGNYTTSLKQDPAVWGQIFSTHRYLTGAVVRHQPDVIVWPETMFRYPLLQADRTLSDAELSEIHPEIPVEQWRRWDVQRILEQMSAEANAGLVIGIDAHTATKEGYGHYNSAVYVHPEEGISGRYDKIHRVPFGEYIPLKKELPFLAAMTPFRGDFGIHAGRQVHLFRHGDWRFLPLICFEDTVPHLVRRMVAEGEEFANGQIDCLVNLTNDGWFHGSSELDQHLITAQFRCIETRTPMVRAVNTGISAIIDGDGVVREPEVFFDLDSRLEGLAPRESIRDPKSGRYYKQLNCALVANVPLDPRQSLYVATGDWFAAACLMACIAAALHALLVRKPRAPVQTPA